MFNYVVKVTFTVKVTLTVKVTIYFMLLMVRTLANLTHFERKQTYKDTKV